MPIKKKQYMKHGYYHIFIKAHVDRPLFRRHTDYEHYKRILSGKLNQFNSKLIAYVLLEECIHLLIDEHCIGTISSIVHGANSIYARYYNQKYGKDGPVFSGRFRKEAIHHESELLNRVKFIHRRPLTVEHATLSYPYSSYNEYIDEHIPAIIHPSRILTLLHRSDETASRNLLRMIHHTEDGPSYFETESKNLYTRVFEAKKLLKEELTHFSIKYDDLQKTGPYRDHVILRLSKDSSLNQQEIADLLSLSRHIVGRVIRYYKVS